MNQALIFNIEDIYIYLTYIERREQTGTGIALDFKFRVVFNHV
jgi:hypothetical protein